MTHTAKTYGEALYELALDEKLDGEILAQLQMAADLFRDNPKYSALLNMQALPKTERCAVLDESFRGRVHPYVLNFLKILTERGLIRELAGCEAAYRYRYLEDNGILEVTATAAAPVSQEQQERLRLRLEERTGKKVRLRCRVDPQLLGGIRLETNGLRLDGTARSRLDDLRVILQNAVL